LHYPAYWHYDVLQGLRLLSAVDALTDQRPADALDVVERPGVAAGSRTVDGPRAFSPQLSSAAADRRTSCSLGLPPQS